MTSVVLDTHVVHWWSAEPERLSRPALQAIESADQLVVASISWWELAWLAHHERIVVTVPMRAWLDGLAQDVRTVSTTPAIAATAVTLPASFPGDPADRLIFATAIENGWRLVTKDQRLRGHRRPRPIAGLVGGSDRALRSTATLAPGHLRVGARRPRWLCHGAGPDDRSSCVIRRSDSVDRRPVACRHGRLA